MAQGAVIEQMPVDSLWPGSVKMVWDCTPVTDDTGFPIWILLCAALFLCIVTSRYIFTYLSDKLPVLLRPMQYQAPLSLPFMAALLSLTVFSCFMLAGSLCFLSLADKSLFLKLAVFLLLFISVKTSVLILAQKASGVQCLMACLRATMVTITCISALMAFFSLTVLLLPGMMSGRAFPAVMCGAVILAVLLYLYKVFVTLFSAGITPFYTFLYLCTLEIVPFIILAVTLTRL